jgi:hypothetical protein
MSLEPHNFSIHHAPIKEYSFQVASSGVRFVKYLTKICQFGEQKTGTHTQHDGLINLLLSSREIEGFAFPDICDAQPCMT